MNLIIATTAVAASSFLAYWAGLAVATTRVVISMRKQGWTGPDGSGFEQPIVTPTREENPFRKAREARERSE